MSHALKRILYISVFIIVLLVGLLFYVKNNQTVELNYIIGTTELPVSLLLLACLSLGALLGILATIPMLLRIRHQKSRLEKQVKMTEKEVNNLRVLPVKHPH